MLIDLFKEAVKISDYSFKISNEFTISELPGNIFVNWKHYFGESVDRVTEIDSLTSEIYILNGSEEGISEIIKNVIRNPKKYRPSLLTRLKYYLLDGDVASITINTPQPRGIVLIDGNSHSIIHARLYEGIIVGSDYKLNLTIYKHGWTYYKKTSVNILSSTERDVVVFSSEKLRRSSIKNFLARSLLRMPSLFPQPNIINDCHRNLMWYVRN